MTYSAREASVADGAPVEFFRFARGADRWTLAASEDAVVHEGETYAPAAITRGPLRLPIELQAAGLEITLPVDVDPAGVFLAGPAGVMTVTVYRRHRGDAETRAIFKGRIAQAAYQGALTCRLACESLVTALQRAGLRRHYGRGCPHALYGPGCFANQELYRVDGVLAAAGPTALTASAFAAQPNGWWVGGKVRVGEQMAFIVAHTGTVVTLLSPLPGAQAGLSFTAYPGCDRTPGTCAAKFNNLHNYGGFPYIPAKNPFGGDGII